MANLEETQRQVAEERAMMEAHAKAMNPSPAAIVPSLLRDYAASIEQAQQMEAWLEQTDPYNQLQAMRKHIDEVELAIKTAMKENGVDGTIAEDGYEAILVTRHSKPTLRYDIPAIEKEPWGSACVEKTVNDKMFKMICEGKSLDMSLYCASTPGTETKAVTVRKAELESKKVE